MLPADSHFAPLSAPGPHPAPAELRAYAAGTLSAADEHRLEAHALDCERCADLLEGFAMSDAPTTGQAVAELRTRLQSRIGAEQPTPVAGGRAWPRIAAAAALVAAVAGGVWTLEQRETQPAPATARLAATVPPASSPPASEAPATLATQETKEAEAAPETIRNTTAAVDYAATTPGPTRQRAAARARSRNNRRVDNFAGQADMADRLTAASPPPAYDQQASVAPSAATSAAGYADADLAPADKRVNTLADSATALSEVRVAARKMKANAAAASAAPTMVANTPMPTALAISPAPVGGTLALKEYLRREASQFVPEINNLRISGTVRLRLIVGADGQLSNIKVTRSLRQDYDEEALRLVCEGPAWQPGIAGGKRAPLPVELAVPF